ncbi:hypothetical protein O1M54_10235 [Streptomyces diastatochromogenes]|nr:hypothetical protein [Streptomyces diastatochromogenes]
MEAAQGTGFDPMGAGEPTVAEHRVAADGSTGATPATWTSSTAGAT